MVVVLCGCGGDDDDEVLVVVVVEMISMVRRSWWCGGGGGSDGCGGDAAAGGCRDGGGTSDGITGSASVPGHDEIVGLSQQVQTLQTALHKTELQNQQLRTRVAETENHMGILMSYMLWMEERLTIVMENPNHLNDLNVPEGDQAPAAPDGFTPQ
nr:hypothetical protein [Tanacetum cinerariifolium]